MNQMCCLSILVICGTVLTAPTDGSLQYAPDGPTQAADVTVTFSCDTDFNLNGDEVLTCQVDGSWSGSVPTCESK